MVELLDNRPDLKWRNFSVPWHDPAMDHNTESGAKFIHQFLETQIIPVDAMLLLSDVYAIKSARKWLDMEIGFARAHNVPIIHIINEDKNAEVVKINHDRTVPWNEDDIVNAIKDLVESNSKVEILTK